jgi:hypothetical protein
MVPDPPARLRPWIDAATFTLISRPLSVCVFPRLVTGSQWPFFGQDNHVLQGALHNTSELASGGQVTMTSRQSLPTIADHLVTVSNTPDRQAERREYQRRLAARSRSRNILRSQQIHRSNSESEEQLTLAQSTSTEIVPARPDLRQAATAGEDRGTQSPESSSVVPDPPTSQLDRSRPTLPVAVTQRSPLAVDIRTSVATEEAHIYATRQAAAAFYLHAPVDTATSTGHIRHRPSRPLYRDRSGSGLPRLADESLMLFRDPPPWSVLEDTGIAASGNAKSKRHASETVVLGQPSTTGAAGMKELLQMIQRRKSSGPKMADQLGVAATPIPRNPFRKNSDGPGRAGTAGHVPIGNKDSSVLRLPLATVSAPQLNSVWSAGKSFKPISALAVPTLPKHLQWPQTRDNLLSTEICKAQSPDIDGPKQLLGSQTHTSDSSKEMVKAARLELKGPPPNLLDTTANCPGPVRSTSQRRVSIQSPHNVARKRGKKNQSVFDWKGWSSK